MRQAVRTSEAYFHSDRMVTEYYNRLYKPIALGVPSKESVDGIDVTEQPSADALAYSKIK
jgi:hypothetical protein